MPIMVFAGSGRQQHRSERLLRVETMPLSIRCLRYKGHQAFFGPCFYRHHLIVPTSSSDPSHGDGLLTLKYRVPKHRWQPFPGGSPQGNRAKNYVTES
jgi:hypothetical protein